IQDAETIVFNACGLTQATQEFSIKIIRFIQAQKKASTELVVCGCLPKINKPRLREVHQGVTFEHEIEDLADIIETETSPQDAYANHLVPRAHVPSTHRWRVPDLKRMVNPMSIIEKLTESYRNRLDQAINVFGPNSFCIKVSTGCPNKCAFCAVKISRGKLRSKPIDRVVEEFEEGLAQGYKEFALLGTDVGAYGRDHGITLVDLLRELIKIKGDAQHGLRHYTIRLRNIQPKFLIEMMPELREILRSGKISYISSAAESGNNRILKLMRRGYTIEDYKDAILTLKSQFPELQIRTQIMVGFPGETEQEFQDSLRLLDEIKFDFVEVYPFQARPNTEAAAMEDQVPQKVIRLRYHKAYMKSLFHLMRSNKKKSSESKSLPGLLRLSLN
ncbi:MAG: radical SAM protein, partial [Dehalococcoidia bacterium]|nr:radical SAM protein [Dehalococcoidia bacterium]